MALNLIFVQEKVERSIYEAIRKVLVEEGYFPDLTSYSQNPAGTAALKADILNIVSSKGYAIELFGAGSSRNKYLKRIPRIVINSRRFTPGQVGSPPNGSYQLQINNLSYTQVILPPNTSNFQIDIHLVSNKQKQDRVMHAIIGKALSSRKYLHIYDELQNPIAKFLILNINFSERLAEDEGIMEKIYSYEVPDIYQADFIDLLKTIAPINEITVEGELPNTADDPIVEDGV